MELEEQKAGGLSLWNSGVSIATLGTKQKSSQQTYKGSKGPSRLKRKQLEDSDSNDELLLTENPSSAAEVTPAPRRKAKPKVAMPRISPLKFVQSKSQTSKRTKAEILDATSSNSDSSNGTPKPRQLKLQKPQDSALAFASLINEQRMLKKVNEKGSLSSSTLPERSAGSSSGSMPRLPVKDIALNTDRPKGTRVAKAAPTVRPFPMNLSPIRNSKTKTVAGKQSLKLRPTEIAHSQSEHSSDENAEISFTQVIKAKHVDPETLCPYCDQPLPENPTPFFKKWLKKERAKGTPAPRWGNSLALKARTENSGFCSRHQVESRDFGAAAKYGWPRTIDELDLTRRVKKLERVLQEMIDDPKKSIFFQKILDRAAVSGKSSVTGTKAAWETFKAAGTGYYGHQGLLVITQVLYDLFPVIPFEKTDPLGFTLYISLVLVPEVALLLIQKDQTLHSGTQTSKEDAMKMLRRSTEYGMAMFPDKGENQADTAGDQLAKNRARKMRKVIDEEERLEKLRTSSASSQNTSVIDLSDDNDVNKSDSSADAHTTPARTVASLNRKIGFNQSQDRKHLNHRNNSRLSNEDHPVRWLFTP